MDIESLIARAKTIELKQLVENDEEILTYVSDAIANIYSELHLTETDYNIVLIEGKFIYKLPFYANGIKRCVDEDGNTIPINDYSLYEMNNKNKIIFIKDPYTIFFSGNFKAGDKITLTLNNTTPDLLFYKDMKDRTNAIDLDFEIPQSIVDPILAYIGYLAQLNYNSKDEVGIKLKWLRYKQSLEKALMSSAINNKAQSGLSIYKDGFE